jgi:DNA-binding response OmpR family regulator
LSKHGPILLVIEDAQDQAILVGIAARRAHPGLDVRTAHDGREGIAYLGGPEPRPDLVILDLVMPEVDGFQVLAWIREHVQAPAPPVVVFTASDDPEDESRARDLGATDVHVKPSDLESMGRVVREIVHEHIGRGRIIAQHIWEEG